MQEKTRRLKVLLKLNVIFSSWFYCFSFTGFMQGGCYVFSKKLLTKFVTKLAPDLENCGPKDGWMEDIFMGDLFTIFHIY